MRLTRDGVRGIRSVICPSGHRANRSNAGGEGGFRYIMTHYVFCFPYRGVGGVPVLFTRIAERVARQGHQASVVDYPDGAMAKAVAGSAISLIPYDDDAAVEIPDGAILVFQSLNPWALYKPLRIADTTRIFFWNCHPFNLVPTFPGLRAMMMSNARVGRLLLATLLRGYRRKVLRFIEFLLAHDALVFMDKTNVSNTENYLGIDLPPRDYLPVPAGDVCGRVDRAPRDWPRDGLRLSWIGRIADFKYPILKATLAQLDDLVPSLGVPVHFAIVGSGEHLEDLRRDVTALKNLRVTLRGELPVAEISGFLTVQTDILFAMGISALEGARLGIPTVLLDVAYGTVPDGYVFSWLHDRDGFTLGEVLSFAHIVPGNRSLQALLGQVMTDFQAVSQAAHAYYKNSHSPGAVTTKFLHLTHLSHCIYKDFREAGLSARDPVYELFARLRKRVSTR